MFIRVSFSFWLTPLFAGVVYVCGIISFSVKGECVNIAVQKWVRVLASIPNEIFAVHAFALICSSFRIKQVNHIQCDAIVYSCLQNQQLTSHLVIEIWRHFEFIVCDLATFCRANGTVLQFHHQITHECVSVEHALIGIRFTSISRVNVSFSISNRMFKLNVWISDFKMSSKFACFH